MKKFFIIGILCLVIGLIISPVGGWAESLPSAKKVAELQKTIDTANNLKNRADDIYKQALDETVDRFDEEFDKAKTDAEREQVLNKARAFLRQRLTALGWYDLRKAKDDAFQKIIKQVDDAYDIDTSNVKGEPTFSQEVEGEGECYPDGRVRIGLGAFQSPGLVASTKKHEATHADQAAEGRWPQGAVEIHDAEIEAYGREITSADTVGLTDAERGDVQERLHHHLEQKKVAMIGEIEAAKGAMDNKKQQNELDKIAGKIRDVIGLEERGDEEGAIDKKDDAIEELDELIEGAKGNAKDTLKGLEEHVQDLKEAELFVMKADTIEDLRNARDAATTSQAQKDEINKIIGKIKNLINAQKKGDEDEALKIKKDALKEINDLLKNAKGATKDNLKKAKEKVEKLIKIESKITVSGKTEGVGKGPDGSTIILVHTKECNRYTVTCPSGTTVKAGQTVTVTGTKTEPGKIKATSVISVTPSVPLAERKVVRKDQYYQGPGALLPREGAYGSFVITPDTTVAVKANGATSSFFIDEEGEKKEELKREDDYFMGLIKPGIIGIVTAGIIDTIFNQQEKAPVEIPGIKVDPYYDGIVNDPIKINVKEINRDQLEDYTLSLRDMATDEIIDYGSPDLYIIDNKTGFATTTYSMGELPTGPKEFLFTDPEGNVLDAQETSIYQYSLSFSPPRVTRGMTVFGNIDLSGIKGEEKVQAYLTFDSILSFKGQTGQVISEMPGEVVFIAIADELNENPIDFEFDTSQGFGEQQIKVIITHLE